MKRGALVSVLVAIAAAFGLGFVFVKNASPYLTVAEARTAGASGIHVVGQIDHATLKNDPMNNRMTFTMKDESGTVNVLYTGPQKSNLQDATQVVVIGEMDKDVFHARDMLVKCPSKYESEQGKS